MTTDNLSMLKALLRSTAELCVFLTLSLIAMLQHFILTLPKPAPDDISITDGIVVATGGQAREVANRQAAAMPVYVYG